MTLRHDKLSEHISTNDQRASASHSAALEEIRQRLDENNSLLASQERSAGRIQWRLQWIKELGVELKKLIYRVIDGNLRNYRLLVQLDRQLATHIFRPLAEDPFIFEDAFGRISPVHLRFVNSWRAFEAVLLIRFENTLGSRKIQRKEYVLHDQSTNREIKRSMEWETAFLPGQRVNMSLIFNIDNQSNKNDAPDKPPPLGYLPILPS